MKALKPFFILICLAATNLYAMKSNDYINEDTITLTGTIIKQAFVNKRGDKMPKYQDYLLATATDTIFIKVVAGIFTEVDMETYLGQSIKITGYKGTGNLDDNGDEALNYQARGGHYIVLLTIEKTNNEDTLTLKGKIVKADMETQKGTKSEEVQDYYFSSGSNSYFIKTAVGKFSKQDLEKIGYKKEVTIKCIKKYGTMDIDSDDPAYAATRTGEYIVILQILK